MALIFNTQGFSLNDGEGIRLCVFFMGCPLRCAWCHNPEGRGFAPCWSFNAERCTGCGACRNGEAPQNCVTGARALIGEEIGAEALTRRILRERAFFEASGGGVTLTGGECLAQPTAFLLSLMKGLWRKGIRVAVDTCGCVPWERFEAVLPYTEVFLYDIKLMDAKAHLKYTGVDNALILSNLRELSRRKANVWLRVPLIGGVNDGEDEQNAMRAFAREYFPGAKVALLTYHDIGRVKYARLGLDEPPRFAPPSNAFELLAAWRADGFIATIGG